MKNLAQLPSLGEYSFTQNFGIDPIGVCHADDLIYLWGLPTWPIGTLNDADEEMRSLMTTVWTNFAKVSHARDKKYQFHQVSWFISHSYKDIEA